MRRDIAENMGEKKLLMRNIVGLVLKKRLPEFAHRTGTGIVRTFFF